MLFIRPMNENDNFDNLKDGLFYIALDSEDLIGYCKYMKNGDTVIIEELEDGGDINIFDGLLRAVFSYVMEAHVVSAKFSEKINKDTLKALFVPVNEDNCVKSIRNFLYNCKKCKML